LGPARAALAHFPMGTLAVMSGLFLMVAVIQVLEWRSVALHNQPYSLLLRPRFLFLLVALTVVLAPSLNNSFIYFAF
jgi:hypothetical protein